MQTELLKKQIENLKQSFEKLGDKQKTYVYGGVIGLISIGLIAAASSSSS